MWKKRESKWNEIINYELVKVIQSVNKFTQCNEMFTKEKYGNGRLEKKKLVVSKNETTM